MRLAVSTVAFPGLALAALPRAARDVGAEGIALGLSTFPTTSLLAEFRERCRDEGVVVSAVYGYAGRRLLDPATVDADVALAKRGIDLAAALEAPVCRMFAGTKPGTLAVINRFAAACQPIVDHAAAAGVRLALPTHHDLASDAPSCRRLIDGLGRAHAGIVFTAANLELDGIDPLTALAEMADLVLQAELKDWTRGGHPVLIGTGDALVWPVVESLAPLDGWLTLHHLRQHHPDLPPLDPAVAARVRHILAGHE